MIYHEHIMRHATSSPWRGTLASANLTGQQKHSSCGDWVSVQGSVVHQEGEDPYLAVIRFQGDGCMISQAAASLIAQALEGRSLVTVSLFNEAQLLELLKMPLGPQRLRCATLGVHALQEGVTCYLRQHS